MSKEAVVVGELADTISTVEIPEAAINGPHGLAADVLANSLVGQAAISQILSLILSQLPGLVAQFVSREQVLEIVSKAIDAAFDGRPFVKNAIKPIVISIVGNLYDTIFAANPPRTEV